VLVTTVRDWREGSRIDGEGDRVTLALAVPERLPAAAPVPRGLPPARLATLAAIDFRAHGSGVGAASSTTDRHAIRLLDGRFRDAVLNLIRIGT
jgi:hypothetical protein